MCIYMIYIYIHIHIHTHTHTHVIFRKTPCSCDRFVKAVNRF